MKKLLIIIVLLCTYSHVDAQELAVSAELKPRFEARHGFGTLASPDDDAALFVSQRARLNIDKMKQMDQLQLTNASLIKA